MYARELLLACWCMCVYVAITLNHTLFSVAFACAPGSSVRTHIRTHVRMHARLGAPRRQSPFHRKNACGYYYLIACSGVLNANNAHTRIWVFATYKHEHKLSPPLFPISVFGRVGVMHTIRAIAKHSRREVGRGGRGEGCEGKCP